MANGKAWQQHEIDYITMKVGHASYDYMAKKLGRSKNAIELKLKRLGMGCTREQTGLLTALDLSRLVGVDNKTVLRWIDKKGLKATRRRTRGVRAFIMIAPADWWKWANKHKHRIDFSRIEPGTILPEPDWVDDARKEKKIMQKRWSEKETQQLKAYIIAGLSHEKIGERLGRSRASIEHKLSRMRKAGINIWE
ncbi:MAG: hypothetical protein GT589_02010 [Peptoclostridium sp.]|uniref:hypothetical protein n=1 Tax=Peptoclostridium sp. TaxID=1904860 RepID=UPI00139CB9EF|nr:hypothetical protein [Peptoclostridium sp.]MZQ74915.1 hypothetical protein [Peptoclostridium sp.]